MSYYNKSANGDLCACQPLSLGHESSGIVLAIGPGVSGFIVGDRVALEVGIPCGRCGISRKGRYHLCKKMRFRSSARFDERTKDGREWEKGATTGYSDEEERLFYLLLITGVESSLASVAIARRGNFMP